jgi:flagellar protein FlgJ
MDLSPVRAATGPVVAPSTKGADPEMVKAAQDFEAIFVQQLVKTMRQATTATGTGILSGKKTKIYQDMLDEEMGRALAQHGGLGVADFVLREMIRRKAVDQKNDSSSPPAVPMIPAEANRVQGGAS